MSFVKQEAVRLINGLSEKVTWDDIMYEFYVRQKIETGLAAVKRGNVLEHETVKKRLLVK